MRPGTGADERAASASTTCQPPVNQHTNEASKKWNQQQQQFEWDRAALASAIERWALVGVARRLWSLVDREAGAAARRKGHIDCWEQMVVEGCAGIRILSSLRRLARLVGCSQTGVDKALGRLESLGLASRGSDDSGTNVVLWIGRLFDAPEVVSAPERPPEKTVSMGVNQVSTRCQPLRPVSVKEQKNQICAASVSVSGSNARAEQHSEFWTTKGLPWQRVTDADLAAGVAGELDVLRVLFREAVKLDWLAAEQAREFLAVCHHAANAQLTHEYRGRRVENPAVALVVARLSNKHFRNLSEESYRFADVLLRRMDPTPESIQQLALSSVREVE